MRRNVGHYLFDLKQADTTSFEKNCAPCSTRYEVWSSWRKKGHHTTSEISRLISLVKNLIHSDWCSAWSCCINTIHKGERFQISQWENGEQVWLTRIIFEKLSCQPQVNGKWWFNGKENELERAKWHVWDFLKYLQVPKRSFASHSVFHAQSIDPNKS